MAVSDQDEKQLRIDLAAAYRLLDLNNWSDMIFTHLSARVPGSEDRFLLNAYGLLPEEVCASNLIEVDVKGENANISPESVNPAGFTIHSALHLAREDAHCVMHSHTTAGMAAASLKNPIKNIDFSGTMFADRIAYHDFEGVTLRQEECKRLSGDLGDKDVMILRNHGLLSVGSTIAQAFIRLHDLERACQVQMLARGVNEEIIEISDNIAKAHATEIENSDKGELAFKALMRLMEKKDPSFKN